MRKMLLLALFGGSACFGEPEGVTASTTAAASTSAGGTDPSATESRTSGEAATTDLGGSGSGETVEPTTETSETSGGSGTAATDTSGASSTGESWLADCAAAAITFDPSPPRVDRAWTIRVDATEGYTDVRASLGAVVIDASEVGGAPPRVWWLFDVEPSTIAAGAATLQVTYEDGIVFAECDVELE